MSTERTPTRACDAQTAESELGQKLAAEQKAVESLRSQVMYYWPCDGRIQHHQESD